MKRVLVVDDHDDSREAIATILRRAGLEVVECNDGQQALSQLVGDRSLPDAIVLDLVMPVMSGHEFLEVLRNYLRLSCLPVIIVTGTRERMDTEAPVVAYLSKPVDPQTLIRRVHEATA